MITRRLSTVWAYCETALLTVGAVGLASCVPVHGPVIGRTALDWDLRVAAYRGQALVVCALPAPLFQVNYAGDGFILPAAGADGNHAYFGRLHSTRVEEWFPQNVEVFVGTSRGSAVLPWTSDLGYLRIEWGENRPGTLGRCTVARYAPVRAGRVLPWPESTEDRPFEYIVAVHCQSGRVIDVVPQDDGTFVVELPDRDACFANALAFGKSGVSCSGVGREQALSGSALTEAPFTVPAPEPVDFSPLGDSNPALAPEWARDLRCDGGRHAVNGSDIRPMGCPQSPEDVLTFSAASDNFLLERCPP